MRIRPLIHAMQTFLLLLPLSLSAAGNDVPDWVLSGKVQESSNRYFGIGTSNRDRQDAENQARIEFSKMVETHVKTAMEHSIQEKNSRFKEKFNYEAEIISDVSLNGITITEVYLDSASGTWYALINYSKDDYDQILSDEINREFKRQKEANRITLMKLEEEQEQEKKLEDLRIKDERNRHEQWQEKFRLKVEKLEHLRIHYQKFIRMTPPHRILNMKTAETPGARHTGLLKGSVEPFTPLELGYTYSFFSRFDASIQLSTDRNGRSRESSLLKVQLLPGKGNPFRTSLAFGISQYAGGLHRISDLSSNLDEITSYQSLYAAGNVNLPKQSLVLALASDKKRSDLGLLWYPFFRNHGDAFALAGNLSYTWDEDFRNRFGEKWLFEPGFQFRTIEDVLTISLSYEQNEYITMTFDIFR